MSLLKALGEVVTFLTTPFNDYELAIKSSKQLEGILEAEFGAEGKGLHEKLNSVQASGHPLPEDLVRKIRFLASVRNKLIHDPTYNRIDDRKRFINAYQTSKAELKAILRARGSRSSECVIM